jgi:Protein of unknown function (DUF3309)
MQHQIKNRMAGTGSADGTPFAYSQTGDQLFVPRWTRFRSARFLFQRATSFFFMERLSCPRNFSTSGGVARRGWTGTRNPCSGTILIILLILLLVGALPTWPYSTGWSYYPGGGIGLILIIVLVLVLVGRI